MRRFLCLGLAMVLAVTFGGQAQAEREETLADIRQQLSVLFVQIQRLNRELSTTEGAAGVSGGGSILDRVNAMESELQRLTAKTEELDFRIQRVVRDGTNRIGDLEFRLCELEAECDISQLSEGTTLGGVEVPAGALPEPDTSSNAAPEVSMAVGERADFERADEALEAGDHELAAELFGAFREAYPGGPLSEEAGLKLGAAREGAGDISGAARAYLDVFSNAPEGPLAPEALYLLGRSLGALGQTDEACVTLGEVSIRFPDAAAAQSAESEMRKLACS